MDPFEQAAAALSAPASSGQDRNVNTSQQVQTGDPFHIAAQQMTQSAPAAGGSNPVGDFVKSAFNSTILPLSKLEIRGGAALGVIPQDRADAAIAYNPLPVNPDSFAGKAGGLTGQMGMALLAPEAAPVLFGAQGGEGAMEDVENLRRQGVNVGTAQAAVDVAGQTALQFFMGKLAPGGQINEALLKQLAPQAMGVVQQQVMKQLVSAGVHLPEGALQQLAANAITKASINHNQSMTQGVGESAVGNAVGAGIMQGVHDYTNRNAAPPPPGGSDPFVEAAHQMAPIPVPDQQTLNDLKTGPIVPPDASQPPAPPVTPPEASTPQNAPVTRPLVDAAQPKYRLTQGAESRGVPLDFESPEDKALYLATVPRKGKVANEAVAYLQEQGYKPEDIARYGDELRSRIDGLANQPGITGDTLRIPAMGAEAEAAAKEEVSAKPAGGDKANQPTVTEAKPSVSQLPGETPTEEKVLDGIEAQAQREAVPTDKLTTGDKKVYGAMDRSEERQELQPASDKNHDSVLAENNPGAKRADPSTLPQEHQEVLRDYKAITGKDMIPYNGGKGRGFHLDGDAYYNVERNNTPQKRRETIAHEATHYLQDTKPELVTQMDRALPVDMRQSLLNEYQQMYMKQEGKSLSTEQHAREIQAMAVGRAFSRPSVARAVIDKNPNLFVRASDAILSALRGLTSQGRATNEIINFLSKAREQAAGKATPEAATRHNAEAESANYLPQPHDRIRDEARDYAEKAGIPYHPTTEYAPVNEQRAKQIAGHYAELKHEPGNPDVKKSYDALKAETMDQYHYLQDKGVKFEAWDKPGQPYKDSADMMRDARDNKHLSFFQGGDLPQDHPLAANAPGTPHTYNDVFRAVHDYFGHAKEGVGFGPRGEENAWRAHSQMYSDEARPAMTTETRGQNSWVNYGPHGEHNQANPTDTVYAEQKAGLLPSQYTKVERQNAPDFLPGVDTAKKFVDDDVKPTLEGLGKTFSGAWDGIKSIFAPQLRSEGAGIAGRLMRERGGTLARQTDRVHAAFDDTEKALTGLPVDQQRAITDAAERGEKQTNPALQPVADAIRQMYQDRLDQLQALNPSFEGIANYMGHAYKDPAKAAPVLEGLMRKAPLEGNKGFLKQRYYTNQSDAIAAGLEPVTDNPVTMMKTKLAQMDKYIATTKVMNDLKDQGLMTRVPARSVFEKKQQGYAQIDDKAGTIMAKPSRRGAVQTAGYWMAPEPVARVINNYLSPGIRGNPSFGNAYQTYLGIGHAMNSVQLLSGFHLMFSTIDTMASKLSNGMRQGLSGDFAGAGKSLASWATVLHPVIDAYRNGSGMMKEWYKPGSTGRPDLATAADQYMLAGGRMHMGDELPSFTGKMKEAYQKGNLVGAAARAPLAVIEQASRPIMEHLIPRLKAGVFYDMAMHEIDKLPPNADRDAVRKVMGSAQDSVDDRLGEMVYDNTFWHHTAKDLMMAMTRSVGWNFGTLRTFGGAATDLAKMPGQLKAGGLKNVQVSNRLAYSVAVPLSTALVGGIIHYLANGKAPDQMKDLFFPKTGRKTKDGDDERFAIPSYVKDLYEYGHDIHDAVKSGTPATALRTVSHKTNPVLNTALEMLTNKDFYNTKIRNEDDNPLKQVGDTAKYLGQQFTPFAARGAQQMNKEGQGARSLLPLLGLNPARKDVTASPAALRASELMAAKAPVGSRTQEQANKSQMHRDVEDQIRGLPANKQGAILRPLVQTGQLGPDEAHQLVANSRYGTSLERNVHHLGLEDSMKVWEVADDDEKRKLVPMLLSKVRSNKSLPVSDKKQYLNTLLTEWKRVKGGSVPAVPEE